MAPRELTASYGQRLLWFLQRSVGESGALNCPVIVRVRGRIDPALLIRAVDRLVQRHEALRTTLTGAAHRLTQVVHDPRPATAEVTDLRTAPDPEAGLHDELAAELAAPVDYRAWPTRLRLWRLADAEYVLCLTMHHLVTDAWSCGVLYRELGAVLDELAAGAPPPDPPAWQYADFTAWQRELLAGPQAAGHRDFWTRQLQGMRLPAVPLKPRARERVRTTRIVQRPIEPAVTAALRRIARVERTTLFAVALAAYHATLHRLTGQDDLAVTSLFANRSPRAVAGTVGFVANMVVLRVRLPARPTILDLVRRSAATARDAFLHECLPYQMVPVDSGNSATQRAEDVVFQMLGEPITVSTRVAGVELSGVVPRGVARFDLELAVIPDGDGLQASLFHASDRLDHEWADAIVTTYAAFLRATATRPAVALSTLPVPTP